jgi:hypothetical protein
MRHDLLMKLAVFPLLLLQLVSLATSQQTPHTKQKSGAVSGTIRSVPDPADMLRRIQANQKQIEQRRKDYICDFTEETQTLDKDGAVKKTETKGYELFFESGREIVRQVSNEGRALDEHEARKEEKRVNEEIKKARERAAKREKHPEEEDKDEVRLDRMLQAVTLKNGRFEDSKGREVLAYDFEPNPDFKPRKLSESFFNKMVGTIWVDPQDLDVARFEARLVEDFKIAGGLLVSLKKGSAMVVEQERINEEVWLPSLVDGGFGARVFLLKSEHARIVDKFSNYRKFRVATEIKPAEP